MEEHILKMLNNFGLSRAEALVYTILLKHKNLKPGEITKYTGIASSKTYEAIHKLINKGLVGSYIEDKKTYYRASPLSRGEEFFEEKIEDLAKQKNLALLCAQLMPADWDGFFDTLIKQKPSMDKKVFFSL